MSIDYKKLKKLYADDPEMLASIERKENAQIMKEMTDGLKGKDAVEIARLIKKGDKGEKGDTPVKGKDYLTDKEIVGLSEYIKEKVKEEVRPIKGKDYFDGAKGESADEKSIIKEVIRQLPSLEQIASAVKIPSPERLNLDDIAIKISKIIPSPSIPTIEDIVGEIKKKRLLELRDIRGARLDRASSNFDMNDQRWHGGGLSNITGLILAGNNVTITGLGTAASPYVINSSGGGGGGLTSINADTTAAQILAVGSAGTDFAIADNGIGTHTFNLPTASHTNRGALSSADWDTFNSKQGTISLTTVGTSGVATFITNTLNIPNYTYTLPTASTTVLGGVKVDGTSITISGGVISATGGGLIVGSTTITSGTTSRILYDDAGVLGEYTLTGTGTVVAMQTAPTFITSITTPLAIGGTGTGSSLSLKSTSGSGATDYINALVGNNGAVESWRALTNGQLVVGDTANNLIIPGSTTTKTIANFIASTGTGTELSVEGIAIYGGVANGATLGIGFNGIEAVSAGFYTTFTDNAGNYPKLQVGSIEFRPQYSNYNVGGNFFGTIYLPGSVGGASVTLVPTLMLQSGSGAVAGGIGLGNGVNANVLQAPWHVGNGNAGVSGAVQNIMILDNRSAGGVSAGSGAEMQFYQSDGSRQKQLGAMSMITTTWSSSPTADWYVSTVLAGTVSEKVRILGNGNMGIGLTVPTASLHLKAGTAAASTAPLKFTAGTNLSTTEAGAIEFDGSHLYFTATNAGTRYQLDQQGGGITIGASTITGGTNTRILYNNSGVVGEYTLTGTGTVVVMQNSPTLTTAVLGSSTATTQTQGDNSTKLATTAYTDLAVANAIAGVNPATAVLVATTAAGDTSGLTYNNGVSGIGATLTGANNTAITIDGHTFVVGDVGISRILVKNDTQSPSGAFNGIYLFTALQTVGTGAIFTRALDYDTPTNINNTGAIPVVSGTANALTSWLLTSNITTVGTSPLTYSQFSYSPTRIIPVSLGGTGVNTIAAKSIWLANSLDTITSVTPGAGQSIRINAGNTAWEAYTPGTGTVTSISIASSNGFAGSSSGGATPTLTISTSITGLLKGNGTAISAATAGSDYAVGSLGLSGGQTIAGSTLTTENLTLRANAADLTTGAIIITSSKEASSSTVGSVQLAGGLAVAKRVFALDMTVTNTIVGAISGNAGTATALATGRTISITGDIAYTSPSFDGSGNVTAAGTLATVNSNVGSFTNASITVNAKGLITAASSGAAAASSADVQTFNASGTWTVVGSPKYIIIQAWGGGGGGGGNGTTTNDNGGGGGGGSYNEVLIPASFITSPVTVTIPAAAAGGIGNNAGAQGGTVTFGTYLSVFGGGGGAGANGTNTTAGGGGGGMQSAGANAATGDITGGAGGGPQGGAGANSTTDAVASFFGGGGAGFATTHGVGGASNWGGGGGGGIVAGGASQRGGGGGAGGGTSSGGTSVFAGGGGAGGNAADGSPGTAPAGGGGGSSSGGTTTAHNGGAGAVGRVIVTSFY